jgi:hypothetical protein
MCVRNFGHVQYIGKRLGDAAVEALRKEGARPLTTEETVSLLQAGGFRFRTPNAIRETHAALNGKTEIKRLGDKWAYEFKEETMGQDGREVVMRPLVRLVEDYKTHVAESPKE